jgi:hypothetical protein
MEFWIAVLVLSFGGGILCIGYLNLVHWLPKKTKNLDTVLSIQALKASFWLVIFGLVIIILGLLYLIDLVPPSDWWNRILPSNSTR